MESQNSEIIQVCADDNIQDESNNVRCGRLKICGEAPCSFSDSKSKDALERKRSIRKLLMAVVLCLIFMTAEVIGGIKANSLAILTDAAHLLSDVAAFAISLFSIWASGWEATPRRSYGFLRIEILGSLVSIMMIWLLCGILVYEATARLIHSTDIQVQGSLMFGISAFGLVVNIIMVLLLGHDHGHGHDHSHDNDHDHNGNHNHNYNHNHNHNHDHNHNYTHNHDHYNHDEKTAPPTPMQNDGQKQKNQRNINVQGAYLHVIGDLIQSAGVMVGGGVIWWKPEWKIIDVICTFVFSIIVLGTTIRMLRNIVEVLMESTPREIDARRLEEGLCEMEEVVAIHELHIWAITVGKILLACHVKVRREADADMVLDKVVSYIRTEYNINHVTIQIERE